MKRRMTKRATLWALYLKLTRIAKAANAREIDAYADWVSYVAKERRS